MPPITELVQKNQQMQMSRGAITPPQVESPAPAPNAPTDTIPGLPTRGTFPPSMILHTDLHSSSRVFRNPQSVGVRAATFPITPAPQVISKTTVQAASVTPTPVGTSILLETNGLPNPVQDILNLIAAGGTTLTPDGQGGVIISSSSSGDGLNHGTTPWETDAGVVFMRDDFLPYLNPNQNAGTNAQIGELGWFMFGNVGPLPTLVGGAPPNVGQYGFSNTNFGADYTGVLALNNMSGSTTFYQGCQGLLENPSWGMTFIWSLEPYLSSNGSFNTAQKAIYIGLLGPNFPANLGGFSARPDVFIGIRYDTSSGLGDTTYVLEAVVNPSYSTPVRNNTQGSTLATNVTPSMNSWHRLDITCTSAGVVTITLDGSSTNTLQVTISQQSAVSTGSGQVGVSSGIGKLAFSGGASAPNNKTICGGGSSITVSGLTGGNTSLNGTWKVIQVTGTNIWFDATGVGNIGNNSTGYTVTGYPALTPGFCFGNDSTSSPSTDTMMFVDLWSFYWNSTGTADATKPRYF